MIRIIHKYLIQNILLVTLLLTTSVRSIETTQDTQSLQNDESQQHSDTTLSIKSPQSLFDRITALKKICDESGATAITQEVLMAAGIQYALVLGWNNSYTQIGVSKIKDFLVDHFIKLGITDISFINYIISTIHEIFSVKTIAPTIETSAYTSAFTYMMDLATDPIACGIWFEIFYTAVTAGPVALLVPQTLFFTVTCGALEGLFSLYTTSVATAALSKIRRIISPSITDFLKKFKPTILKPTIL